MSIRRDVLHSSFLAFVGQASGLVLTFLSSVLIARGLGEREFGEFTFLISFLAVAVLLPDFGLNWILQRELSRLPEGGARVTGTAFLIRLLLFFGVVSVVNVFFYTTATDFRFLLLSNVILMNFIFSSKVSGLRLVLESPYRAEMRLLIPVALAVFDSALLLTVLWFVPGVTNSLENIVVWYTAANIPGFLALLLSVQRERKIRFQPHPSELKSLLIASSPLALYVALSSLHNSLDVFLLKWFWGSEEVGQYGVATRLYFPFIFIPNAFIIGTFPVFSKWFGDGSKRVKEAFQLGIKLMLGIAIGVMYVMVLLAHDIVHLLFKGEFQNSVVLLQILSTAQVFFFLNVFGLSFLTAINRQRRNFWIALTILVVDLVFNLIAIPTYGNEAAALTRVAAELVGTVVLFQFTRDYVDKGFWVSFSKLVLGAFGSLAAVVILQIEQPILGLCLAFTFFTTWCVLVRPVSRTEFDQLKSFSRSSVKMISLKQ
ncbi:MAG: flippase [Bacteroidota bacterium]